MPFGRLLRNTRRRRSRAPQPGRASGQRFRPAVETLEQREVPTTFLELLNPPPVTEGRTLAFALRLTNELGLPTTTPGPIDVQLETLNGSATAGDDYQGLNRTLTIPTGATGATFTIPTFDDDRSEGTEVFLVLIRNLTGTDVAVRTGFAVGEIRDDEPPVQAAIVGDTVVAENSTVTLTVRLSAPVETSVAFSVFVNPDASTATFPNDFGPEEFFFGSILPGDTDATFTLTVGDVTGDKTIALKGLAFPDVVTQDPFTFTLLIKDGNTPAPPGAGDGGGADVPNDLAPPGNPAAGGDADDTDGAADGTTSGAGNEQTTGNAPTGPVGGGRNLQDLQVTIEARLVELPEAFFERIGVPTDDSLFAGLAPAAPVGDAPPTGGPTAFELTFLSDIQVFFLEARQAGRRLVPPAPVITIPPAAGNPATGAVPEVLPSGRVYVGTSVEPPAPPGPGNGTAVSDPPFAWADHARIASHLNSLYNRGSTFLSALVSAMFPPWENTKASAPPADEPVTTPSEVTETTAADMTPVPANQPEAGAVPLGAAVALVGAVTGAGLAVYLARRSRRHPQGGADGVTYEPLEASTLGEPGNQVGDANNETTSGEPDISQAGDWWWQAAAGIAEEAGAGETRDRGGDDAVPADGSEQPCGSYSELIQARIRQRPEASDALDQLLKDCPNEMDALLEGNPEEAAAAHRALYEKYPRETKALLGRPPATGSAPPPPDESESGRNELFEAFIWMFAPEQRISGLNDDSARDSHAAGGSPSTDTEAGPAPYDDRAAGEDSSAPNAPVGGGRPIELLDLNDPKVRARPDVSAFLRRQAQQEQRALQRNLFLYGTPRDWRLYNESQHAQWVATDPTYQYAGDAPIAGIMNSWVGHAARDFLGTGPPLNQLYRPGEFEAALRDDQFTIALSLAPFGPVLAGAGWAFGSFLAGAGWAVFDAFLCEPLLTGRDLVVMVGDTVWAGGRGFFGADWGHWNPTYYSSVGQMVDRGAGYWDIASAMGRGIVTMPEQFVHAAQTGDLFALGQLTTQSGLLLLGAVGPVKGGFNYFVSGMGRLGHWMPSNAAGQFLIRTHNRIRTWQVKNLAHDALSYFERHGLDVPSDLQWKYDFVAKLWNPKTNAWELTRDVVGSYQDGLITIYDSAFVQPFWRTPLPPGPLSLREKGRALVKGSDARTVGRHELYHAHQDFIHPDWYVNTVANKHRGVPYEGLATEFTQPPYFGFAQPTPGAFNFQIAHGPVTLGPVSATAAYGVLAIAVDNVFIGPTGETVTVLSLRATSLSPLDFSFGFGPPEFDPASPRSGDLWIDPFHPGFGSSETGGFGAPSSHDSEFGVSIPGLTPQFFEPEDPRRMDMLGHEHTGEDCGLCASADLWRGQFGDASGGTSSGFGDAPVNTYDPNRTYSSFLGWRW